MIRILRLLTMALGYSSLGIIPLPARQRTYALITPYYADEELSSFYKFLLNWLKKGAKHFIQMPAPI